MRRLLVSAAAVGLASNAASAAGISSVYTDFDPAKTCVIVDVVEEGSSATSVCSGYGGFPVIHSSGDLRDMILYGFPPAADAPSAWESFAGFNSAGPKIEWRVEAREGGAVPFATIHRRFVSDPDDEAKPIEVLVVSKVAQLDQRDGCVVGLVLASGNPTANEMAQKVADEQAADFACGADERVIIGSPMPEFSRDAN